jgi:hypothetical protein
MQLATRLRRHSHDERPASDDKRSETEKCEEQIHSKIVTNPLIRVVLVIACPPFDPDICDLISIPSSKLYCSLTRKRCAKTVQGTEKAEDEPLQPTESANVVAVDGEITRAILLLDLLFHLGV